MPSYILLMKLTDQGIKAIKDAPGRIEAGIKGFEAMGGKVLGFYTVMGEYDYVAVGEAPSDEVATTFALALGSQGNVRTTTLRAYTKEEFAEMVKKLP
ncbi:MAG: GYD domain-containing protein [Chloroflexota bacterium]